MDLSIHGGKIFGSTCEQACSTCEKAWALPQGKAQDFSQVEHAFSHIEPKVLPTWLDRSTFKKSSLPAGSQVEHAVSQVEHVPRAILRVEIGGTCSTCEPACSRCKSAGRSDSYSWIYPTMVVRFRFLRAKQCVPLAENPGLCPVEYNKTVRLAEIFSKYKKKIHIKRIKSFTTLRNRGIIVLY